MGTNWSCLDPILPSELNKLHGEFCAKDAEIKQILTDNSDFSSGDVSLTRDSFVPLNEQLQKFRQLGDLCEEETAVLVLQSHQNGCELQSEINKLQFSIEETRRDIEHLQRSEWEFREAANQLNDDKNSFALQIADVNRSIEQAESRNDFFRSAHPGMFLVTLFAPVALPIALGSFLLTKRQIETFENRRCQIQTSASVIERKLQEVQIQLANTTEMVNKQQATLEEAREKWRITVEKRHFWLKIHASRRQFQAEIRHKSLIAGNMAAMAKIPMALLANDCLLSEAVRSSIKSLKQPDANSTSVVVNNSEWQKFASLKDVELFGSQTTGNQLLSAPLALLKSIAQFSAPNDVSLSAELISIQLQMGNHTWTALKVLLINIGQFNRITSFLDESLKTTGHLMRQSKDSSQVSWKEIDQRLIGFKSQSSLLTAAIRSIQTTFKGLSGHLNKFVEQLLHNKHISEETKSALIRDIEEIDAQMNFVGEQKAKTAEEIRLQREIVNDAKNCLISGRNHHNVLQKLWQLEDAKLEIKKEHLRSVANLLHHLDQQHQHATYKLANEEIYTGQVVDLTKCLTAMKQQVWYLVSGFSDSCGHLNYAAEQLSEENEHHDDPAAMLVGRQLVFAQYEEAVGRLKVFQPTFTHFEAFYTRFYMTTNSGSGEDN